MDITAESESEVKKLGEKEVEHFEVLLDRGQGEWSWLIHDRARQRRQWRVMEQTEFESKLRDLERVWRDKVHVTCEDNAMGHGEASEKYAKCKMP